VRGTSHQLAVAVADKTLDDNRAFMPAALFSGGVEGETVVPVFMGDYKTALSRSLGFPIIANFFDRPDGKIISLNQINVNSLPELGNFTQTLEEPYQQGTWVNSTDTVIDMSHVPLDVVIEIPEDPVEQLPEEIRQEAKHIDRKLATEYAAQGMEPLAFAEKTQMINEYLINNENALQAIVYLLSHDWDRQLTNTVVALANNLMERPVRPEYYEAKAENIQRSGRMITAEDIRKAGGVVTPAMMKSAPVVATNSRLVRSLGNMWENNFRIKEQVTKEDFIEEFKARGFVPTPSQAVQWAHGNTDIGSAAQELQVAKGRNYISYLQMLGSEPKQEQIERVQELVDKIYLMNSGKGPNEQQNKDLINEIKREVLRKNVVVKGNLLSTPQVHIRPSPLQKEPQQPASSRRLARFNQLRNADETF